MLKSIYSLPFPCDDNNRSMQLDTQPHEHKIQITYVYMQ